jgi:hypothetical protein
MTTPRRKSNLIKHEWILAPLIIFALMYLIYNFSWVISLVADKDARASFSLLGAIVAYALIGQKVLKIL